MTSSGQKRLRREALPIAEGKSISIAWLRPMQDIRNSRITGQLLLISLNFRCTALRSRSLHSQNWPALLVKPKLVRDPGAGLHGLPSQVPPCCHGTGRHAVPFQRRGLREIGTALSRLCLVAVTQSLTRRNFEAAPLTGLA